MIRYDTEDEVTDPQFENSVLASFRLDKGRGGQFIVDRGGKKIPLTGLVFGRHHHLFDLCSHIQVYQPEPGEALILFVPLNGSPCTEPQQHFNSKNVDIQFRFCMLEEPIRSPSGKVHILVTEKDLQRSGKSVSR